MEQSNRPQNFVPIAALKRFSDNLEKDSNPQLNKFISINKERVNNFIAKPFTDGLPSRSLDNRQANNGPGSIPIGEYHSSLSKQNLLECQPSLGARSRFGEGDGSFFDLWLTSDIVKTRHLYDENQLPTLKHSTGPAMGFKRFNKQGHYSNPTRLSTIRPYAEIREERLKREKMEKGIIELPDKAMIVTHNVVGSDLHEIFDDRDHRSVESFVPLADRVRDRDPPILSPSAKETYFGGKARASFFDYYRHLSRQRLKSHSGIIEDTSVRVLDSDDIDPNNNNNTAPAAAEYNRILGNINAQYDEILSLEDDSKTEEALRSRSRSFENTSNFYVTSTGATAMHEIIAESDEVQFEAEFEAELDSSREIIEDDTEDKQELHRNIILNDFNKHHFSKPTTKINRPISARRKFIINSLKAGIAPRPSVLIRKYITSNLNVSSQAMGDDLAQVLAKSLDSLPALESINIANNNLTDIGLSPIINSLLNCPTVTSLNISNNKVDDLASQALFNYVSAPSCNLVELIMQKADIDDLETARFITAISIRHTIQEIDLSENLLGSHEIIKLTSKRGSSLLTGGESIALLLKTPECSVKSLKLAWNKIHYGGIALAQSLRTNTSLCYLDLSYNCIGGAGGEMLGDALHLHRTLKTLKVASNNINARGSYVLISGVRSCSSLQELDLSNNPIGEVGATAVMNLNIFYGDEIDVDITGCAVKTHDKSCWFDSNKLKNDYKFDLSLPYDRAVCIDLLRIIAEFDHIKLVKYKYSSVVNGSQDITLYNHSRPRIHRKNGLSSNEENISHKLDQIYEISSDVEKAKSLFRDFDVDGSGSLDRDELESLISALGIDNAHQMVKELLSIYDADNSGVVEEGEFSDFLDGMKKNIDRSKSRQTQISFLSLVEESTTNSKTGATSVTEEYHPPSSGVVECSLEISKSIRFLMPTVSASNVASVLKSTKSVADSSIMIENALNSMHLKYDEALVLYRIMMKDAADKVQILQKLLLRISTSVDARKVISHVVSADGIKEFARLRQSLGNCYKLCLGIPNGYYILNLSTELDRMCIERLYEISSNLSLTRQTHGLGDTSQNRDWLYFRNTIFDGNMILLTDDWLKAVPHQGRLEFDFIAPVANAVEEKCLSNVRFYNILESLGVFTNSMKSVIISKIEASFEHSKQASKGVGFRSYEIGKTASKEMASHVEYLYNNYQNRQQGFRLFSYRHNFEQNEIELLDSINHKNPANEESRLFELYSIHIDNLNNKPEVVSKHIVATRIFDALEVTLSGRYINCAQLAVLVEKFNYDDLGLRYDDVPYAYSSWRTEIIIMLFGQVVDLINFEHVLKCLKPLEYAILMFRLGILNIWNPMKPEGWNTLNLARKEEKQAVRILASLGFIEPGENFIDETFQLSPESEQDLNWSLPLSWATEIGIPDSGVITFRYFSGEGIGLNDCKADAASRIAFMSLVLAQAYAADVKLTYKPTLERAEIVLSSFGIKLSFNTSKQEALIGSAKLPAISEKK